MNDGNDQTPSDLEVARAFLLSLNAPIPPGAEMRLVGLLKAAKADGAEYVNKITDQMRNCIDADRNARASKT